MAAVCAAVAKDTPFTIDWPEKSPTIRFTVLKFRYIASSASEKVYAIEMSAENISGKPISSATPQFYLFDKKSIRIGDGYVRISNLGPKETVKFTVDAYCNGTPDTLTLAPSETRKVAMTIYSVPAGAQLQVDHVLVGETPMAVALTPGSHSLEFEKQGYNKGTFPLVVTPNQLNGGSVTFELGSVSYDIVELRDGTVINCDVQEVNATQVVVRVGGNLEPFDRNKVKRISLVERQIPNQ